MKPKKRKNFSCGQIWNYEFTKDANNANTFEGNLRNGVQRKSKLGTFSFKVTIQLNL